MHQLGLYVGQVLKFATMAYFPRSHASKCKKTCAQHDMNKVKTILVTSPRLCTSSVRRTGWVTLAYFSRSPFYLEQSMTSATKAYIIFVDKLLHVVSIGPIANFLCSFKVIQCATLLKQKPHNRQALSVTTTNSGKPNNRPLATFSSNIIVVP